MSACTSHVCPYMSAKGIRADLHSHSARVVANIETHLHNSHKALWCILEYTYIGPREELLHLHRHRCYTENIPALGYITEYI